MLSAPSTRIGFGELKAGDGTVVEILLQKQAVKSRDHVGDRLLIKCWTHPLEPLSE
jgi:hypothetical protein